MEGGPCIFRGKIPFDFSVRRFIILLFYFTLAMTMVRYPILKPLDMDDQQAFEEAFTRCPPVISEYTFANLYGWRRAYNFQVCSLDDFLLLVSLAGEKKEFFDPIGTGDKKSVIARILRDAGSSFIRLPQATRVLFEGDGRFAVTPDRDFSDYVYRVRDLAELNGKKYDGKRNLIKKFTSQYSWDYVPLAAANAGIVLEFEEQWCSIKDCDSVEGLREEREAVREMAAHFGDFHLTGAAVRIEGVTRAIAIAQALNRDTLVLHVLKANQNFVGLYQFINQEFFSRQAAGFTYANFEQDVGSPGLRKAKESYHPCMMVDKYAVSLENREGLIT